MATGDGCLLTIAMPTAPAPQGHISHNKRRTGFTNTTQNILNIGRGFPIDHILPSDCGVSAVCAAARFSFLLLKDNAHFAADVMSKGLGAILSTGSLRAVHANSAGAAHADSRLQIVPGAAVLGLPLDVTEQLRPRRQRLAQL
jgi:hypothetical protein